MFKKFAIFLSILAQLYGCGSKTREIRPPDWGYEKAAIQLKFSGDNNLNLYRNRSHSMVACVYHLRDLGAFNQMTEERSGLSSLLECNRFDPSVTYSRRVVVQPNRTTVETRDRTDGAKYLGIIAGYYNLDKTTSVRSYAIPVTEEKIKRTLVQKPAKMNLELHFGPQGIVDPEPAPQAKVKP
jgi:type VI secretion system VasD/TssJ family lipoprotein